MQKLFLVFFLFFFPGTQLPILGQGILLGPNLHLPKDSLTRIQILHSLNSFIAQISKSNKENSRVDKQDFLASSALMDEMKKMEEEEAIDSFYKPYFINCLPFNDSLYYIQLAYLGTRKDQPVLRACFTLLARKKGYDYFFSSPFKQNTLNWKYKDFGNTRVYYKNTLRDSNAKRFFTMLVGYDKKLNASPKKELYYAADNFPEVLRLLGVDYKSDYTAYPRNSISSKENDSVLHIDGISTASFENYDPHDFWHERLHFVLSQDSINRPVDEGTAYLYGGSYGISWKDILSRLKEYANQHPDADWLRLYNESLVFDRSSGFPLYIDYAINGLMVQKIEKENGFPKVMELLRCGKKEKGNANYFLALERITGIRKSGFNKRVRKLILDQ